MTTLPHCVCVEDPHAGRVPNSQTPWRTENRHVRRIDAKLRYGARCRGLAHGQEWTKHRHAEVNLHARCRTRTCEDIDRSYTGYPMHPSQASDIAPLTPTWPKYGASPGGMTGRRGTNHPQAPGGQEAHEITKRKLGAGPWTASAKWPQCTLATKTHKNTEI